MDPDLKMPTCKNNIPWLERRGGGGGQKSRYFIILQENCQIKAVWQEEYTKFNTEIKADAWN